MLTSAGVCDNGANVVENLLNFFQVFRPLYLLDYDQGVNNNY